MAVTRFNSQCKPMESSAKYQELVIPWQSIIQIHSTTNATGAARMGGTGVATNVVAEIGAAGLGGIQFASTDEIDFLVKVPNDMAVDDTAYIDVYYYAKANATKGDRVGWTVTYDAVQINPTATTSILSDATTTSGITNPTSRVLATGASETCFFKDSATIAASTLTQDYMYHFQLTAGHGCTEGELVLEQVVVRYAKRWM